MEERLNEQLDYSQSHGAHALTLYIYITDLDGSFSSSNLVL